MTIAQIELEWNTLQEVNTFMIQEYIPLGQRIKKYSLEIKTNGEWIHIEKGATIGNKRLIRFETTLISAFPI